MCSGAAFYEKKEGGGKALSKVRWSNNENLIDFPDELATRLIIANRYSQKRMSSHSKKVLDGKLMALYEALSPYNKVNKLKGGSDVHLRKNPDISKQ